MSLAPGKFRLVVGRWYAAQLIGEEFPAGSWSSCSPLKVLAVHPLRTGDGLLELTFHHENYPEGVQQKRYRLKVLAHDPSFVFARREDVSDPLRHLLIVDLTWEWLHRQFGIEVQSGDPQDWQRRA